MSTEPSLLNRAEVRRFVFKTIEARRPGLAGKMTRISEDFFLNTEAKLKAQIVAHIENHNSAGKTIT